MKQGILIVVLALGCGHGSAYRPATSRGNQCENECVGIARTCQAAGGDRACRQDLEACRTRCYDFNGGTFQHATAFFWDQPQVETKTPPEQ